MPTDPLTASRYPASTAAPNVPQDIQNAVSDLSINTIPRFATTAARDAAYTAYTNAGGVLANGRSCWTDDVGGWRRIGGAWVYQAQFQGSLSTAPSNPSLGDTYYNSVLKSEMVYLGGSGGTDGAAWRQTSTAAVQSTSNIAAYVAAVTAAGQSFHYGFQVYEVLNRQLYAADSGTTLAPVMMGNITGTLSIFGGWAAYSGYHTPSWTLSSTGIVTLSGMVQRTGASFALGTGSPFQFATLPAALVPTAIVSPICYAGLGASVGTYPARAYVAANSTNLSLVGMDSGTGTMTQTVGFINLDGVTFHV